MRTAHVLRGASCNRASHAARIRPTRQRTRTYGAAVAWQPPPLRER